MLKNDQPQLDLYADFYEKIIPKDNLLRKIKETVDFSFIYDELESKYCLTNGRNAESPVKLFKYLLLKCIAVLSDVDVVEQSRYDMSFKYFLDLAPADDVIEPSTLTKFRKQRLKDENGQRNFKLISKLNPIVSNGIRQENKDFISNKDADMVQCKAGCLSKRKAVCSNPDSSGNTRILYYFDVKKCRECPFKNGCYKGGKTKIYAVRLKNGVRAEHEEFMKTEEFKTKAKERYKIEAKNSESKNNYAKNIKKTALPFRSGSFFSFKMLS